MKRFSLVLALMLMLMSMPVTALAQEAEQGLTRGEVADYLLLAADDYTPGLTKEDLVKGYGNGQHLEDQRVTRIEALIMLSRAFPKLSSPKGNDLRIGKVNGMFTDVPSWAKEEIARLSSAGILLGYPDGTIGRSDRITQGQLEALTKRIYALQGTNAGDDFYEYVNKKWLNESVIEAGEPMNGAFVELVRQNEKNIKNIVDDLLQTKHSPGSKEQKITDFYTTALDLEHRNEQGIAPIQGYLDAIEKAGTLDELFAANLKLEKEANFGSLASFGVMADAKNSSVNALYFSGIATGMDKNSYLSGDERKKQIYLKYLTKLFVLAGDKEAQAKKQAEAVYAMEKELAAASLDVHEQGDVNKYYNPYTMEQFAALYPSFAMTKLMKETGLGQTDKVIVTDVGLAKKSAEYLSSSHVDVLKSYMKASLLMKASTMLTDELAQAAKAFTAEMYGVEGEKSQQDIALQLTTSTLSDLLGEIYAEAYFSKEAKQDVESMVKQFIEVYKKRIMALDWMSDQTKAKAVKKLEKMTVKIGYPDQWNDTLKDVKIAPPEQGGSLLSNLVAINNAYIEKQKASLGKSVDKGQWIMSVYEVNAYYNPLNNEIVFPAGILQAPFYDLKAKPEANLGAIGMVIAHEISHAFDNLGSSYDENGNANNWWTTEDYEKFEKKLQSVIEFYDGIEVIPGVYNQGKLTVSENVADLGGMAASLQVASMLSKPDYKSYFEGYAAIWRSTMTREIAHYLTTVDTHSANKVRVNRTVSNFKEFYEAYGIESTDALYVAPEERVSIW
ncbi:M13-type metalloendopeptidase [Paenibacillus aquistagni]|uniref:Putative endopeptidase n=1 Tax=Paenibacillus aquistagni TaxID=1852522 RepID=A0A1X7IUD0_9BACL|nr:M13-type metalloendopeptidase [Paenibacillus aquistagni]SMG18440.1 putative endopeptidase [Paenibacillus aquistagni]